MGFVVQNGKTFFGARSTFYGCLPLAFFGKRRAPKVYSIREFLHNPGKLKPKLKPLVYKKIMRLVVT